jgi:hypothetical protein
LAVGVTIVWTPDRCIGPSPDEEPSMPVYGVPEAGVFAHASKTMAATRNLPFASAGALAPFPPSQQGPQSVPTLG